MERGGGPLLSPDERPRLARLALLLPLVRAWQLTLVYLPPSLLLASTSPSLLRRDRRPQTRRRLTSPASPLLRPLLATSAHPDQPAPRQRSHPSSSSPRPPPCRHPSPIRLAEQPASPSARSRSASSRQRASPYPTARSPSPTSSSSTTAPSASLSLAALALPPRWLNELIVPPSLPRSSVSREWGAPPPEERSEQQKKKGVRRKDAPTNGKGEVTRRRVVGGASDRSAASSNSTAVPTPISSAFSSNRSTAEANPPAIASLASVDVRPPKPPPLLPSNSHTLRPIDPSLPDGDPSVIGTPSSPIWNHTATFDVVSPGRTILLCVYDRLAPQGGPAGRLHGFLGACLFLPPLLGLEGEEVDRGEDGEGLDVWVPCVSSLSAARSRPRTLAPQIPGRTLTPTPPSPSLLSPSLSLLPRRFVLASPPPHLPSFPPDRSLPPLRRSHDIPPARCASCPRPLAPSDPIDSTAAPTASRARSTRASAARFACAFSSNLSSCVPSHTSPSSSSRRSTGPLTP